MSILLFALFVARGIAAAFLLRAIPKLLGEVTRGISSGVANCIYEQGHLDIDPVILHGDLWVSALSVAWRVLTRL